MSTSNFCEEVLAYKRVKYVEFKNPSLGLLSLCLKVVILLYIVLFEILYKGRHLQISAVDGLYRMTLQQPTKSCNPDDIRCHDNYTASDKLPYCNQSQEPYETRDGKKQNKLVCKVLGRLEAFVDCQQGHLLATRINHFKQVRTCVPTEASGWKCPHVWQYSGNATVVGDVNPNPGNDYFVADIERFTLMFDHNLKMVSGVQKDDHDMKGFWLQCPRIDALDTECTRQTLLCKHEDCPKGARTEKEAGTHSSNGRKIVTMPNGAVGMSIRKGDVFSLGTLLSLAGVDLDQFGRHDSTFRRRGLTLVVSINYRNYDKPPDIFTALRVHDWFPLGLQVLPWHQPQPYYTYRVHARDESYSFKVDRTFDNPLEETRSFDKTYGVRVIVQQRGNMAQFDEVRFLVTMTTSLGMLAVASKVTDLIIDLWLWRKQDTKRVKKDTQDELLQDKEIDFGNDKVKAARFLIAAIESSDVKSLEPNFPQIIDLLSQRDP